ncbi:hypothetical protein V2G26_006940 [Clonostachys chloroleuca]
MTSYDPEQVEFINPEDIPDLGSDDEPRVDVEPATEEEIRLWWTARYDRSIVKPIDEPLTAPWGLPVSSKDLEKLKAGFRTRSMDDKWDLLVEDPDDKGNISLHILRNWEYAELFILHIVSNEDSGGAVIQHITWEGNWNGHRCEAEQAQKEAVILCRLFLKCEFETVPQYPSSVMWSPEAYKKLGA